MVEMVQERVRLREFEPSDLQFLRELRSDTKLQNLMLAYPKLDGVGDTEAWLDRRMQEFGGLFKIIAEADDLPIGFVQIANVHRRGRYGYVGICLTPNVRGRGYGAVAMKLLIGLASESLGLRKLILESRADNFAALHLYEKLGFSKVGSLIQHYYDGKDWFDVVLMERQIEGLKQK